MAAIFDFRHALASDSISTSLSVLPDCENMGKAVEITLLSWLKAEIYVISCLLPVLSRHFGYLVIATLVLTPPSCSPAIFRKVTRAFLFTHSGYEMAAKIVAWGVILPPSLLHMRVNIFGQPTWLAAGALNWIYRPTVDKEMVNGYRWEHSRKTIILMLNC